MEVRLPEATSVVKVTFARDSASPTDSGSLNTIRYEWRNSKAEMPTRPPTLDLNRSSSAAVTASSTGRFSGLFDPPPSGATGLKGLISTLSTGASGNGPDSADQGASRELPTSCRELFWISITSVAGL
jgi:hypothetical protein